MPLHSASRPFPGVVWRRSVLLMPASQVNDLTCNTGEQQRRIAGNEDWILHQDAIEKIENGGSHLPDEEPLGYALDRGCMCLPPNLSGNRREQDEGGKPAERFRTEKVRGQVHGGQGPSGKHAGAARCAGEKDKDGQRRQCQEDRRAARDCVPPPGEQMVRARHLLFATFLGLVPFSFSLPGSWRSTPRSAPVTGSREGSEAPRAANASTVASSSLASATDAEPSPPSSGVFSSDGTSTCHCSPLFQGPDISPSPGDVFTYRFVKRGSPGSLPGGKLLSIE